MNDEASSHTKWPSWELSRGGPDPGKQACTGNVADCIVEQHVSMQMLAGQSLAQLGCCSEGVPQDKQIEGCCLSCA